MANDLYKNLFSPRIIPIHITYTVGDSLKRTNTKQDILVRIILNGL
jgi:hypothetical protein